MDWKKNDEVAKRFKINRNPIDFLLPIIFTILFCYGLTFGIMLITSRWFNIIFFVDTLQRVAGSGMMLSLLAFTPRLIRVKMMSEENHIKKENLYTKSELKSKLSDIDVIVLAGTLLTILTSLSFTPLYYQAKELGYINILYLIT